MAKPTTSTESENFDNAAYIEITSDRNDEETPLVTTTNATPTADTILVPSIARYRPTNLLRSLLLIEFLTMFLIWLFGSSSHYLIDDITHYTFTSSIFDLVSVSLFKLIVLILCLTEFEEFVIKHLYRTDGRPSIIVIRYIFAGVLLLLSLCTLAFAIVKLTFVVRQMDLSKLYLSTVYLFLIFSSIELIGLIVLIPSLSRIKLIERARTNSKRKVDLKRLLSLSKDERVLISLGFLFLLISSATQIVQPYYFGKIVDEALNSESMRNVTIDVLILFGINCLGGIASFFRAWIFELAGQRVVYRLRQNIFDAIIQQEIGFFDDTRTGELTNRLSSDTQVLQNAVTVNISMLFRFLIQILGSLVVMFYLEVTLTLVLMVVVPIIVLIAKQYGGVVQKLRKRFQDELAGAGTTAEESISNIRTVRIFGAENKVSDNYQENLLKSYRIGKKMALSSGFFMGLLGFLTAAGISIVLWYGAKLVHDRKLTVGLLSSFLMYMLQVAMALAFLASLFGDFMQAVGASERIFNLLDRQPKIPCSSNVEASVRPDDFDGSVHLDNVTFTYPTRSDQKVLHRITFEIRSGQKVALVGPSGGGKSTIASLIERYYDPEEGNIYFGSNSLKSIDPHWLRQNVSFVNQEPSLFACSIRDNITFGIRHRNVSLEEIQAAAKQANAHDFIEQFENKYDTLVGERGVRLSGGQRQRIAIARALLMSPKLLLLDEATSALDAESEHLVQQAIERAMVNRTVLVIAHRLSTVRNADLVIVIDQGRIVEQGTHESLLEREDGVYKKLVLRQLMVGNNTNSTVD